MVTVPSAGEDDREPSHTAGGGPAKPAELRACILERWP
jgi:hypothetical protein